MSEHSRWVFTFGGDHVHPMTGEELREAMRAIYQRETCSAGEALRRLGYEIKLVEEGNP